MRPFSRTSTKDSLEVPEIPRATPYHPGSRGKNCAKGPATINQVNDPERILHPAEAHRCTAVTGAGSKSHGKTLSAISAHASEKQSKKIAATRSCITLDVPVTSATWTASFRRGASTGTTATRTFVRLPRGSAMHSWSGSDRPSPDHANARFILLLSAHLESGHYFNPHAQRILEGKLSGAKIAVMDPRLSNHCIGGPMSGSPRGRAVSQRCSSRWREFFWSQELFDRDDFVHDWVNWRDYMKDVHGEKSASFDDFVRALIDHYEEFTPEHAEAESGVSAEQIVRVARQIGAAGDRFAAHIWRGAASGNLGGWQVARALQLLSVLTGSVGTKGGNAPELVEQVQADVLGGAASPRAVERALVPERVAVEPLRDGFLATALDPRRPRPSGRLFHPGLQPGLDESRRARVDGGPQRRGQGWASHRAHANVERIGVLRGLRFTHGARG